MSQKDPISSSPAPAVAKGMGKGMAAMLIALVSVGAFVGAGVGTYLTFSYVILPSMSGSNHNNSNNNSCTSNCNNGGGSSGCTSNCHSSNIQSTSNGVTLTLTQYGFSSNSFNGTLTASQSRTLNSGSISGGSNSCSFTAPSGQGLAVSSTPANFNIGLTSGGNGVYCSGSLTSFNSGTTYTVTLGDTNGDTFTFSVTD